MKSNEILQKNVQDAINWEPILKSEKITVIANDGVVTLSGTVNSYAKKIEVENTTKKVVGVIAVVVNIKIHLDNTNDKSDTEIANEILSAWKWNWNIPDNQLKLKVENGWVTIDGKVDWNYEKEVTEKSLENISGVKGVTNNILINSTINDRIEEASIASAFARSWAINQNKLEIHVDRNNVKLTGIVGSLYQKEEAARLAWNTPGVWSVDNELIVKYN